MAKPIVISILTNASQAKRELNDTASMAEKVGGGFRKMAAPAAVALASVAALGKGAIDAASASEQSIGATETVFKQYADQVISKSKEAAQAIGISANEYRELSNVTGAMLKSSGMPLKQVADLTDQLNTRAADLAATFGGSTKEAVEAIGSLLRGEANPIERYGVSIKQADVNARLAAEGLSGLTGEAKKTAEQEARLALLFEQTADAQGQFAREADTAENAKQRNAAAAADLRAEIGTKLLPAYIKIQQIIATVIAFLTEHQDAALKVGVAIVALAGFVLAVNAAMRVAAAVTATYTAVTSVAAAVQRALSAAALGTRIGLAALAVQTAITSTATKAAAAGQWLLNAAMTANPIGLVVVAIAALVAGLVLAYQNSETFRNIVQGAFAAVAAAGQWLWEGIKAVGAGIAAAVALAGRLVRGYVGLYVAAFNFIIAAAGKIIGGIRAAFSAVINFFREAPGRIKAAFGNAGTILKGIGGKIIDGLVRGIRDGFGKVKGALGDLTGKLTSWKGPEELDKRLLTPAGEYLIDGFVRGIQRRTPTVKRSLTDLTRMVADTAFDPLTVPGVAVAGGGGRGRVVGGNTYTIKVVVAPTAQPHEVGRELVKAIDAYERLGGRR